MKEFKIAVFGQGSVGKTSIIKRYLYDTFMIDYTETIEDVYRKTVLHKQKNYDLKITDTAGNYQFPAMRKLAIQRSHAFIIVYDLSKKESFLEAKRLFDIIYRTKDLPSIPVIVVGNKTDKEFYRESEQECEKEVYSWADEIRHITTSARDSENIDQVFQELIDLYNEIDQLNTKHYLSAKNTVRYSKLRSVRFSVISKGNPKQWGLKRRQTVSQFQVAKGPSSLNKSLHVSENNIHELFKRHVSLP